MASNQSPLHILALDSSIGDFPVKDAVQSLTNLSLRPGSGDAILLGLAHRNEGVTDERVPSGNPGISREFVLNGLRGAERILKGLPEKTTQRLDYSDLLKKGGWEYLSRWNEAGDPSDTPFETSELVNVDSCYRYPDEEIYLLFETSKLRPVFRWKDHTQGYSLWLLERPTVLFPLQLALPEATRSSRLPFPTVPTIAEWAELWKLWDTITLGMIPPEMLHQKPIDLRHKCLFYLGHIPGFLDIQLGKALKGIQGQEDKLGKDTEPIGYQLIFERGIDPNVDDPTQVHSHSEVPEADEDWPTAEQIHAYRDRVRARLLGIYNEFGRPVEGQPGVLAFDRKIGRYLWMGWEHEAFHAETLLYMLIQRAGTGTIPPKGFVTPPWGALSELEEWKTPPSKSETIDIGPSTVVLGHDDFEAEDDFPSSPSNDHEFGWDNESPKRNVAVGRIKVEKRPVLNGEFYNYWKKEGNVSLPASWVIAENGDVQVRTLFGPVPLSVAQNWPFVGQYDHISAFAKSKGGRIATEPELVLFQDLYEGSEESNVGLKNWHPIPPREAANGRRGHNGGVWEWTSTTMHAFEGYVPSRVYPGYSSDFFDGSHHVVLGGSYVTVPRQAQRRTIINFYQHNYPYMWVGGRVVYDA